MSLQPMILPERFDMFFPLTGGCSEGLDAFRYFFKHTASTVGTNSSSMYVCMYVCILVVITYNKSMDQIGLPILLVVS